MIDKIREKGIFDANFWDNCNRILLLVWQVFEYV